MCVYTYVVWSGVWCTSRLNPAGGNEQRRWDVALGWAGREAGSPEPALRPAPGAHGRSPGPRLHLAKGQGLFSGGSRVGAGPEGWGTQRGIGGVTPGQHGPSSQDRPLTPRPGAWLTVAQREALWLCVAL